MARSPAPGTVFLVNHERKDTIMRKTISLGTVGIAGVVTAGLLVLPIASAVTGDDETLKRDDDAPELALVDEDDRDADPATRATATGASGDQSRGARTHVGQTRDGQTGATATAEPDGDATGNDTATGDVAGDGDGSGDDVSGGTGD